MAIRLALDRPNLRFGLTQLGSNGSNLCESSGCEYDTFGSAFCNIGRAVSDVDTITWACLLGECFVLVLANWQRFSGEQCLVGLEVYSIEDPVTSLV
jgi:hypothetical protein